MQIKNLEHKWKHNFEQVFSKLDKKRERKSTKNLSYFEFDFKTNLIFIKLTTKCGHKKILYFYEKGTIINDVTQGG